MISVCGYAAAPLPAPGDSVASRCINTGLEICVQLSQMAKKSSVAASSGNCVQIHNLQNDNPTLGSV